MLVQILLKEYSLVQMKRGISFDVSKNLYHTSVVLFFICRSFTKLASYDQLQANPEFFSCTLSRSRNLRMLLNVFKTLIVPIVLEMQGRS